jgi:signal transduction histidine kinase
MSRTVDDLLTLAAVDGGVLGLRRQDTELAGLAETVAGGLDSVAAGRDVTVEHDGPPVTVPADPVRLGQAIRSAVENAIEFSPQGGTVRITTSLAGTTGRLVVEDDGPGVPPALREHVFDRFFCADPSRSRATAAGSGWRSRARSSRPTAAACTSRLASAEAPSSSRSRAPCPRPAGAVR